MRAPLPSLLALALLLLPACQVVPPSFGVQQRALCQVPDGGADAAPSPGRTERLFDENTPPRLFQIEIAPADLAFLEEDPRLEQYVPAAIEVDGERFEDAAIRYKGAYGSLYACFDDQGARRCSKLSLKVSFNEYDPAGRFQGVRKLVFNASYRDPSYLHERLSYALFRAAGVGASRAVHARLSINGGPESLFVLVEAVDKEWIQDRFADDQGNLFKEVWPQHQQERPYLEALRTNERSPDVSRMVDFAAALAVVRDADFNRMVDDWIDREQMLRYFVVDQLTHNWDGIWKFYCHGQYCGNHNFFIYDDPTSRQLAIIPWDLDHTFNRPNKDLGRSWWADEGCDPRRGGGESGIRAPQCDPLLRGLMRLNWERYRAVMAELTAPGAPLSEAAILARLDRLRAMIEPHVAGDPLGPSEDEWRMNVARLRQVVREHAKEARRFLDEAP